MKAHLVTLLIIDLDQLGADAVEVEIENCNYPNDCISPNVLAIRTADIGEWDDAHPLNRQQRKSLDELEREFLFLPVAAPAIGGQEVSMSSDPTCPQCGSYLATGGCPHCSTTYTLPFVAVAPTTVAPPPAVTPGPFFPSPLGFITAGTLGPEMWEYKLLLQETGAFGAEGRADDRLNAAALDGYEPFQMCGVEGHLRLAILLRRQRRLGLGATP